MGCRITAMIDSPFVDVGVHLQQVPAWFEEWEQALSRFRPNSELSLLNQRPGEAVAVSPALWEVFRAARRTERASSGLVTPVLLNELEAAGYDRSFDLLAAGAGIPPVARHHSGAGTDPATIHRPSASLADVTVDEQRRTLTLPAGMRLDFGGSVKAWAAHQAMQRLVSLAPALVNAGGDIAISGWMGDGTPWLVGVLNPFDPENDLATLALQAGGVATSGQDYRRWEQDGVWKHHIIDPRCGLPAETDLVSVTIVAATVMQAEMAAKLVFILGSRAGLEWLESHAPLAGLLVLEDGSIRQSGNLQDYLWREA